MVNFIDFMHVSPNFGEIFKVFATRNRNIDTNPEPDPGGKKNKKA